MGGRTAVRGGTSDLYATYAYATLIPQSPIFPPYCWHDLDAYVSVEVTPA